MHYERQKQAEDSLLFFNWQQRTPASD